MRKKINNKNNPYQLPLDLKVNTDHNYGSYEISYTYNNIEYYRVACYSSIYHKEVPSDYLITFHIDTELKGTNWFPFDTPFLEYYLTILQEYFNFNYKISINKRNPKYLDVECHMLSGGQANLRHFTTAVRFSFENARPAMLLAALYLLQQNEENVNLFTLLSVMEKVFPHNSGHGLTYSNYICNYTKTSMQLALHSNSTISGVNNLFGVISTKINKDSLLLFKQNKYINIEELDTFAKELYPILSKIKFK